MVLFDFMLVALCACQLTEVVRHGSIFAPTRAYLEAKSDFLSKLISCGFCFSHWAAAVSICLLGLHYSWVKVPVVPVDIFYGILLWLAATRVANLLNDFTKPWSRTPTEELVWHEPTEESR